MQVALGTPQVGHEVAAWHHTIVTSVRARAHERVTYLAVRDNQISTGLHVVPLTSVKAEPQHESENRNVRLRRKFAYIS